MTISSDCATCAFPLLQIFSGADFSGLRELVESGEATEADAIAWLHQNIEKYNIYAQVCIDPQQQSASGHAPPRRLWAGSLLPSQSCSRSFGTCRLYTTHMSSEVKNCCPALSQAGEAAALAAEEWGEAKMTPQEREEILNSAEYKEAADWWLGPSERLWRCSACHTPNLVDATWLWGATAFGGSFI